MKKLFSELVGPLNGKPILVICGGPSVAANLKHIPLDFPAAVISANEHGFKQDRFKVDFTVNCDFLYAGGPTPMSQFLKKFGRPVINRWSWADYRLPEWNLNGDSGLTAVVVAAMLGGHPVVPLGLDRNVGAKRYFWEAEPPKWWTGRQTPNVDNIRAATARCVDICRNTSIRLFESPMRAYWPIFNHPTEQLPKWTAAGMPQETLTGELYQVNEPIFLHPTDRVDGGVIRLTKDEANPHLRAKKIAPILAAP